MRQQPLEQIRVPATHPDDLNKILLAWGCSLSEDQEDDTYIRKFIATPMAGTIRYEVKKSAFDGLRDSGASEEAISVEIVRNVVTIVFNKILWATGVPPKLPSEILDSPVNTDEKRLIDETPPDPVT